MLVYIEFFLDFLIDCDKDALVKFIIKKSRRKKIE